MNNHGLKPEEDFLYLAASWLISTTGRKKGSSPWPATIAGAVPLVPLLLTDITSYALLKGAFCVLFGLAFYLFIEVAWLFVENVKLRIRLRSHERPALMDIISKP